MERLNKNFWKKKKVFVTGATGIVGSWVVKELLSLGADVTALIYEKNPDSELYRSKDAGRIKKISGGLQDFSLVKKALKEKSIDTVFHIGAQAIVNTAYQNPLETFEANIRGTYHLLESCRLLSKQIRRIVVASSDKAYGEQPRLPYTEDMPLQGRFPYEASKSCTDLLSQSYFHSYALPVVILRCGNIYGGGDLNWNRIVPGTIRSYLQKERPIIRSDGLYIRDYVYVKDVARTYLMLAEHLEGKKIAGEAFNFSSGRHLNVLELVKIIQEQMGCHNLAPQVLNEAHGEIREQYLSNEKIKKALNWQVQYDLKTGLDETIGWYDGFLGKRKK